MFFWPLQTFFPALFWEWSVPVVLWHQPNCPLDIVELGPSYTEPSLTSHGLLPDYPFVLWEAPSCSPSTPIAATEEWDHYIPTPSCTLDTFLSLVFNSPSPSCSLDISAVLPDNSNCLLEDSAVPPKKPGLNGEKGFDDLSSLATSLSELFLAGEAHCEVYDTYGLKGSKEEVLFYKECIETPHSLVLALGTCVVDTPSPSSISELPLDQGELTGSLFQSWAASGSVCWALCDPSTAHTGHKTEPGSNGSYSLYPVPYTS